MSHDKSTLVPHAPQASRRSILFGIAAAGVAAGPDKKWHRMQRRARHPALRAAERQRRAASKLADRLRGKIDRTRAYTVAGLAAKAQVAAIEGEGEAEYADTTLASILRDMKALKGRAQS
jgi:hypothetical protein